MAALTNFNIDVANPLGGLGKAVGGLVAGKRQQDLLGEAKNILSTGSPEQISAFVGQNPGMAEIMQQALGFKTKMTMYNAQESSLNHVWGRKPLLESMKSRADMLDASGIDSTGTRQGIEKLESIEDPADRKRAEDEIARKMLAGTMQPDQYKNLFPEGEQDDLIGKVNPDDWTPESMAEYARTGDYGVLEAAIKPPSEMSELTRAIAGQTLADKQQAAHTRRREQAATTKAQQTEAQNRTTLEEGLPGRYKNASEEEQSELMEVAQSAPNAMAARKEVEATRERQRKDKKAVGLTTKSVDLLASILENPELDDVIGPREGKEGSWFNRNRSGPESDAMADIRELTDLLTVPNLDIITGPMSDSDIAMVGRVAGGGLDRTRSEAEFRKRAVQMLGALGVPTVTSPAEEAALNPGDTFIAGGEVWIKE